MPSRMRRPFLTGIAIFVVLAASALGASRGTSFASPLGGNHTARHAHALTNVYFILNWVPNVEFAGLWVADHFGWWKQAGIKLGFKPWAVGVNPETDVPERGGNTFGFQAGASLIIAASKGVPDTALYTDTQRSVFGLTVLAKSKIHSLRDLKGKRVGYQPHELYAPETMLSCVGLTAGRDYRTVPVSFDITQLTAGNVDAYLTFLTNEPIALQLKGVKTRSFRAADYCYHFYDDVMFTTKSLIRQNPALVKKVTQIVARGFRWAHTHPTLAARITVNGPFSASVAGGGVSAASNALQQKLEMQKFSQFSVDAHGHFSGTMTTKYWQDGINILSKYGQITHKPSAASIFTNRFNPYH